MRRYATAFNLSPKIMAVQAQGEAAQVQGKGKGKGRVMRYQIDYEDLYNFGSDQDGKDNEDDL